jgi:hypothetical protein
LASSLAADIKLDKPWDDDGRSCCWPSSCPPPLEALDLVEGSNLTTGAALPFARDGEEGGAAAAAAGLAFFGGCAVSSTMRVLSFEA